MSNKNSSVVLKPPPNLALLFNQFNNSSPEQNIDSENVVNSRYYDLGQILHTLIFPKKKSPFLSSILMHFHYTKTLMILSIY